MFLETKHHSSSFPRHPLRQIVIMSGKVDYYYSWGFNSALQKRVSRNCCTRGAHAPLEPLSPATSDSSQNSSVFFSPSNVISFVCVVLPQGATSWHIRAVGSFMLEKVTGKLPINRVNRTFLQNVVTNKAMQIKGFHVKGGVNTEHILQVFL